MEQHKKPAHGAVDKKTGSWRGRKKGNRLLVRQKKKARFNIRVKADSIYGAGSIYGFQTGSWRGRKEKPGSIYG
jgi:hypothetical protein